MEDSLDSNVFLVVPSTVDDSEPNALATLPENPLGIPVRPLDQASASVGDVQSASFACFQLSGRGQGCQSESSESLHIDDGVCDNCDIIGSSPGVMHVELAGTPSATIFSGLSTTSHESCESEDVNSGEMSPDMITYSEGDVSSADMMSLDPRSSRKSASTKESKQPHEQLDKKDPDTIPASSENIFEADTESYSQSNFSQINFEDNDQGPNSFTFFQQATSRDEYPTPVILTASTQADSEKRDNPPLNHIPGKDPSSELDPPRRTDEVMDIDSQQILIKDVAMTSPERDAPGQELEVNKDSNKVTLIQQDMESQSYTQDLNLHLTFESQQFDPSFPTVDSQALIIDERSELHTSAPTLANDKVNVDSQKTLISKDSSSVSSDKPVDDNTLTGEESPNLDVPSAVSHRDSQISLSKMHKDAHDEELDLKKQDSAHPENPPTGPGVDSIISTAQGAVVPSSEMNKTDATTSSDALPGGDHLEDAAPSISTSSIMEAGSNSRDASHDSPNSGSLLQGNESKFFDQSDFSPISNAASHSVQNISTLSSIPNSSQRGPVVTDRESFTLEDVSSTSFKTEESGINKQEVSPSMQSTYIDENNNRGVPQSVAAEGQSQSFESVFSSQPITSSYDASVENSSVDPEADIMGLPLSDLETQSYTMTPREDSTETNGSQEPVARDINRPLTEGQGKQGGNRPTHPDHEKTSQKLEDEVRPIVEKLVNSAAGQSIKQNTAALTTKVSIKLQVSKVTGQSSKSASQDFGKHRKGQSLAVYDYRSQSQPSQDIQLKSPFRSPTSPSVRERSGGRQGEKGVLRRDNKRQMERDGNNNVEKENDIQNESNEEHDKSSDTLPSPDDSSDQNSLQTEDCIYRVTKIAVVEKIVKGQVVETRTIHKKPKICQNNPYPSSSHSPNGSGYLADTSSLSRTSSDSSTQTDFSHSPGSKSRHPSEPALRSELSGSSTSSGSSVFAVPSHPPKSLRSPKEQKTSPSESKGEEDFTSPVAKISSPSSTATTPVHSISMASPPLKKSMVLLTPLSNEFIVASVGTMGSRFRVDIATPPTSNINPPLSGSTPVETKKKDDSTSDITTSNSPEIGYPGDSIHGSSFPFDTSPTAMKSPDKSKKMEESSETPILREGIPVMARLPTETFYYPGMMQVQHLKSGKYAVLFEDDDKERMIRESDILIVENLNVGQEVHVQSDSDDPSNWYSPGIILSIWREGNERGYVVEKADSLTNTKKGRRYARKCVIVKQESLTRDQKLSRVQPMPGTTSANVSLDNIVDGKRRSRRSKLGSPETRSPASSKPSTPSPSSTSKTPKSSRKRRISDSQSSSSSASVPFPSKKSKRGKLTYGSSKTPTKKLKTSEAKVAATYKKSKIFKHCVFLLTSTTGRDQPSSEFESPPSGPTTGYDREDIRKKISAGDGTVVKDFTELISSDCVQRYVISDNFCRTMNYFNALAFGIKCLSYFFVNDSTSSRKLKPTEAYKLPAGYSLNHQTVIERPAIYVQPLSHLQINLQMKDTSTWSPLLLYAGCDVVSSRQDENKNECSLQCDVIVADGSCSAALMERAKSLTIPVVSIEWVIQCLISSEKLPFDGHSQFKCFTQ